MKTERVWLSRKTIHQNNGIILLLQIQAGASKSQIKGEYAGRLKLSIACPPVEGKANQAIILFLSKLLKIPQSTIHLLSGELSNKKVIWIESEMDLNLLQDKLLEPIKK